jgi:S-DNA-T family DNA segregation ATPase FtsK/SpoIIIE
MSATQRELRLEFQSDRIEMVLASYKAPARVMGGVVTPRAVQFHLAPMLGTKINRVQALADELALALGVSSVRVSRQGSSVQLEIPRDDARPVKLLSLMPRLVEPDAKPLPPGIAVLGLCDDGAPLLLRLPSPDVAHVLIAGTTGSGKTALCQTMILSLAMTHRRSQLQFVLVDPKRHAFKPFARLPHLLRPVIGDATEAVDALRELVRLMEARRAPIKGALGVAQGETPALAAGASVAPRILVVLDELADLTVSANAGSKALNEHLTRLVQRGREAGIHVMACTQKPSSQVMGTLIRANFPVRLVGKVVSPDASRARVAAGIGGTGAEKLVGRGDFVAIAAGQVIRFQAAYVSAAEMDQVVAQMGSTPRRWDVVGGRPSLLHQAVALVAGTG